jgi:hypothetical protein
MMWRSTAAALLAGFIATGSHAGAACLDITGRVAVLFAAKGQIAHIDNVGTIKLDCTLTVEEWGKLQLSRQMCAGTSIANPSGGKECRILEVDANGPPENTKFERAIRRFVTD